MLPNKLPSREHSLIAILRGVSPTDVVAIARVVYEAGIRLIEVPLNSPDPYASIAALSALHLDHCLIGAGTVLNPEQAQRTHDAGGRLVVAPNCDPAVISAALHLGMQVMPGIATASEAFVAIAAGARHLKLFPAISYGPRHLQALRAVMPSDVRIYPVGGVGAADLYAWLEVGAAGFGLGSELYRPGFSLVEIGRRAGDLVAAFQSARQRLEASATGAK